MRALPLVVVLTVLVGGMLGWLIHRSVTGSARPACRRHRVVGLDGPRLNLPLDGPTEVRELTRSFNVMTDELAACARPGDRPPRNLRHDLRTPLTVITGFAAALLDGTAEGPERERAAGRSSRRPAGLVRSSTS